MPDKNETFKLIEITVATEKFESAVSQVFRSTTPGGIKASVSTVIDLLNSDKVLSFILEIVQKTNVTETTDEWYKKYHSLNSTIGKRGYELPDNKEERARLIYDLLNAIKETGVKYVDEMALYWYNTKYFSEIRSQFLTEFLGSFHNYIKNVLLDLTVKADLSETHEVTKEFIVNIIAGENFQLNQNSAFVNSEAKQEFSSTVDQ